MMRLKNGTHAELHTGFFFNKMKETISPTSIGDENSRKHFTNKIFMFIRCHFPTCQNIQKKTQKVIPPHRKKKLSKILSIFKHTKKSTSSALISLTESKSTSSSTPLFAWFMQWENIISYIVFPINTKNDALLSSKNGKFLCANGLITRTDDFSACPLVTGPQLHERSRDLIIASFFDLLSHGIVWSFCIFFFVRIKKITSMFFVVLCNQSGCFAHQFLHFRCLAMRSHFLELGIRLELSICFAYCPA